MKQGDLVRLLRQFVNIHAQKGEVGLLISVRPKEAENPMGWIDHTQFTHQVLAGGEVKLYREEDLERVFVEPRESANCDSRLHHGKKRKKGL